MRTRCGGRLGPGFGVAQSRHTYVRRRKALSLVAGHLLAADSRLRGLALSSRVDRHFPWPRAPYPSWAESSLDDPPPFVGNGPVLSLRGQRPPTLVGNGPQLSLFVGNGPLLGGLCPLSPQADLIDPSGGPSPLRLLAGWAQPRRGAAIPCARLSSVSLATAGSPQDRAKSRLVCALAVACSLWGRVALRTRCAR